MDGENHLEKHAVPPELILRGKVLERVDTTGNGGVLVHVLWGR